MIRTAWLLAAVLLLTTAAPVWAAVITFTVVDEAGGPVAGAEVGLFSGSGILSRETDAKGRARIAGVSADDWTAWAAADGYTGEEQDVETEEDTELELRFVLGPGIAFSGTIVDSAGEPVRDAYIEAIAGGSFEGYGEWNARPPYDRVSGGDDGTFRIRGIPDGAVTTLVVEAEGFRETRFAVRAQGDGVRPSPIVIVLDRGGTVEGSVLDPDGKPVGGAVVFVVPADDPELVANPRIRRWSTAGETVMAITARSGEGGGFTVSGLALGKAVVALAEGRGYARSLPSPAFVPTEDRRGVEVELKLRRTAALVLHVTNPDGTPIEKGIVRLGAHMGGLPSKDAPDGPGLYRFPDLPPGEIPIEILATGLLRRVLTATLVEGEETVVEVALDAGATVFGVVRDRDGKPVAGATVRLERKEDTPDGGWSQFTSGDTETNEEGRFEFRGLATGLHELDAYVPGELALLAPLPVKAPMGNLEIVLDRMGKLRMKLVSEDKSPVPARVFVWEWRHGGGSGFGRDLEDGVLVLRYHRGDPVTVEVRVDGFVPLRREVTVPMGEVVDLGTVVLDPGVSVRGRVTDLDGKAVEGALVVYGDRLTPARKGVTGSDGAFDLPHLPAGRVGLSVGADGLLPFEGEFASGKDAPALSIELRRGEFVTGCLVDGDGNPLEEHRIQFRRPPAGPDDEKGEFLDQTGTEEDGTFTIRLPEGPCRVLYITQEKVHVLAELKLTEGGEKDVRLVLE